MNKSASSDVRADQEEKILSLELRIATLEKQVAALMELNGVSDTDLS